MPIVPDTKNWTWVLERPCPECGFDASGVPATAVRRSIRENAAAWPAVLRRSNVRERPDDSTWSPLEYAAHVRDVFRVFAYRLELMLTEHDPLFPNWDQDKTAIDDDYAGQDPETVSRELAAAAETLAAGFDAVDGEQWTRSGRRSDGVVFTVESLARYLIHDPVHHLWDVTGR